MIRCIANKSTGESKENRDKGNMYHCLNRLVLLCSEGSLRNMVHLLFHIYLQQRSISSEMFHYSTVVMFMKDDGDRLVRTVKVMKCQQEV